MIKYASKVLRAIAQLVEHLVYTREGLRFESV
nr:tRNA-Val [Strobilanthes medahinnensis]UAY85743.1 tRNA-Val [Strobilanthes medahinnensis]